MMPNLAEPSNLPEEGFNGKLVYIGRGRPADLAGKALDGAAVLMDFDSGRRWVDAVEMGAKVVIFLAPREGSHGGGFSESSKKFSFSPVNVPRFYLERSALSESLGANWQDTLPGGADSTAGIDISIRQPTTGKWVEQDATTEWLFIPGTGKGLDPSKSKNSLVHIQAYKDSNSIVPDLSPGGAEWFEPCLDASVAEAVRGESASSFGVAQRGERAQCRSAWRDELCIFRLCRSLDY